MAQWGQGFQYPMQTGYNPQQYQQGFQASPGLAPQPTGFPGQRPSGFQQPQQTGFPGVSGFQQPQQTGFPPQQTGFISQQTGFPGAAGTFQQRPPPPPVPPIPSQFQQQNAQGFMGVPQQQAASRFMSASPLTTQPTGFAGGGMRPLVSQVTGFVDPRLQMMSTTFLPANPSMPYNPAGMPQLPQQGDMSLQQSFQQHNQAQRGNATPKIPWALSKAEKKNYDQIFRAWDVQGTGFISGQTALEVFGQSGLDKNDLAKVWALADADNRGKLNLAEFHVAMGLIYRRLNGNDIPDELPPELVPPSHRDLDTSVNLLKDILKNDTRGRSPSNIDSPVSKLKERSFLSTSAPGAGGRQDATVYKYNDESPPGGFYQPRSRHVDRNAIRTHSESENPAADLDDMKRQLENTARMLDRSAEENASRTAEDEALEREMSDLRYKVNRVKEDLEYVSRGPRSVAKDEERRKLERELMKLMHERIPELEGKIKDREEKRAREKREWARERDRRNERFGRYDDREDRYSSSRYDGDGDREYRRSSFDRDERDRDPDYDRRPYSRNRDRDYERDRDKDYERDRDRDYGRDRDRDHGRDYDRPRSPPAVRSPPPAPPSAPPSSAISKPPPVPIPSKSPAPATKNMTPEERQAFIRAEAQRRMQERMAALGVVGAGTPSPKLDTTVEDRLVRDKVEAEEKARAAEKEAEERERTRRERLEREGAGKASPAPAVPAPPPPVSQVPTPKPIPPPPKPRAPAPPPPRKAFASRAPAAPAARATPPAPAPPPAAPSMPVPGPPQLDAEEQQIRAREEALRKQREERLERLRQLEKEEEEAKRAEEEYQARRRMFEAKLASPPPTVVSPPAVAPPAPALPPPAPVQQTFAVASPPPPPPPPPAPAVSSHTSTPSIDKSATNPFSRLMKESPGAAGSPATPAANGSHNPFFKPQAAASPAVSPAVPPMPPAVPPAPPAVAPPRAASVPPPSRSPAPRAVKASYHTAPGESDEDWEDVEEKDNDDSSDDEIDSSRATRDKLAQQLFGSMLPPSRPQSAAAMSNPSAQTQQQLSSPAPPPPPPPPPSASLAADNAIVPPPPMAPPVPVAPPPPAAPAAVAAPAPTNDRNALLSAIQHGAKLRKAQTNDRSAAPVSGKVLGGTASPEHISAAPRSPSPPQAYAGMPMMPALSDMTSQSKSSNRQSVDWYAGLAADGGAVHHELLPAMQEEEEEESHAAAVPSIQVEAAEDPLADVDRSIEYRVRSLYPYEGQRAEDLSFAENLILTAYPSKSGGDWWYGTLVRDGKAGFFPKTYVERVQQAKAKALYSYEGNSSDELPFSEGDELTIVDHSETDWWKAEQGGVVFIVPAGYLELLEASEPIGRLPAVSQGFAPGAARVSPPSELEQSMPKSPSSGAEDNDESGSTVSSSDYDSSSESEPDEETEDLSGEVRAAEREARELERQRVLEAAGFIFKSDMKPPPRPVRPRSRKRRPPPAVPDRSPGSAHSSNRDLPHAREGEETDNSLRLDDAFERYEAFKQANPNTNRLSMLSMASMESGLSVPSPTASALSVTRSPSTEPDGWSTAQHFFSLFGRSKTPAEDGGTRTMPVISGPIVAKEPSSPGPNESEAAFGSSWASLVDKSALEEIPVKERRRQEAIFELITTEAAYVRDLQLIVEHFYAKLMDILDEKAIRVIFANVEDILLTNTTFLSSLEERQKECRLYVDKIGDILKTNMSEMGVYVEYCVNQSTALKVLQSLRESDEDLAIRLRRLRDDPTARNLDLSSYLLVPMQRITRYPLLIRQILHYTEVTDDRDRIGRALEIAEKILEHINETIREQEGRERLKMLSKDLWIGQGRLDLTEPTRYMGARKLLKEGTLMKAKSGRKLRVFLCSDILVLTEEGAKHLYRTPIPLAAVHVQEVPGHRDDLTFKVSIAYPRGGDAIALRSTSARDCQLWMQAIDNASRLCREAEKKARNRHNH